MGRTQNVMNFTGIVLQLALTMGVGWLAEHSTLASAFHLIATFYLVAGILALVVMGSGAEFCRPKSNVARLSLRGGSRGLQICHPLVPENPAFTILAVTVMALVMARTARSSAR